MQLHNKFSYQKPSTLHSNNYSALLLSCIEALKCPPYINWLYENYGTPTPRFEVSFAAGKHVDFCSFIVKQCTKIVLYPKNNLLTVTISFVGNLDFRFYKKQLKFHTQTQSTRRRAGGHMNWAYVMDWLGARATKRVIVYRGDL